MSVFGGVWFEAQALCFLLITASLYYLTSTKRLHWYIALLLFAFAVGCRPLDLVYTPIYVWFMHRHLSDSSGGTLPWGKSLLRMIPYFVPFAAVGLLYAIYNYVRFQSPFEFGHNYLPEFLESEHGQFNFRYILDNWRNIFQLPSYAADGSLTFPKFNGFAFYIANPLFVVWIVIMVQNLIKRRKPKLGLMLPLLIVLHMLLTLSHKTLGGWQFGIRYFIDMLPFVFLYIYLSVPKLDVKKYQVPLLAFALMINLYGTLWFYLSGN